MSTLLHWNDPDGNPLTILRDYARLEYIRAEGAIGWLTLDLEPSQIDTGLLRENMRIEPWRSVDGGTSYLDGESVYFLRRWGWKMAGGVETVHLQAYDANYLIDGAIVAYAAASAQADQTNQIDDMIKDIVRQNRGADATDTLRDLSAWLTVQADLSAAPSTTKGFSHRKVLAVLKELCDDSYQQGTYLTFDTVYTSPAMLEFRTYTGQRGVDHGQNSAQPVNISLLQKNLEDPEYYEDHTNEANYIYAGGVGTETNRVIKTANSADALGLNRRELWVDARNNASPDGVQSDANAALYANRARKFLTGKIVDTEGCTDGIHYRYGDIVHAEYKAGFDAHINAMHVTIEGGMETRENYIRGEA